MDPSIELQGALSEEILEQRKRNMAELQHMSHDHPLVFNEVASSLSDTAYHCAGCAEKVLGSSYSCGECRFYLHKRCAEAPSEIHHPAHRQHPLLLLLPPSEREEREVDCSFCREKVKGFYYQCVPCNVNIHVDCASPQPIVKDKSHHPHPFTLLLRPNNPFHCSACGDQGNHVSYTCSPCNLQVHKDCDSLPRHIRLTLHPHPISHNFFLRIDHDDSRTWDCRICYKKVNIEYGSYSCSRPGCDFVIHVECSIKNSGFYHVVEVENPNEVEEPDWSYEPKSCIVRTIKEIKVGDDVIAGEIEHVSHKHNLIFSEEIKDNKYCNGCVLPILSSFYYCPQCDFFLHKACAELSRKRRPWVNEDPWSLVTNGIFECRCCHYKCNGFSYKLDYDQNCCLRCAIIPHGFTYQADEPHFIFFDRDHHGECNACDEDLNIALYKCKDCTFSLHMTCTTLPQTVWHKCDVHSLTLAYHDPDDYPLRHYCDICEEERDPQKMVLSL